MSTLFLSKDELADLSGVVRPTLQIRWLRDNGWRYSVDFNGKPRVSREHFSHRLVFTALPEKAKTSTPRFDRLNDPDAQLSLLR
jgi:Domain of unknown function (DUF4224)